MKRAPKGFAEVTENTVFDDGARVIVDDTYVADGENAKKYFVTELSSGYCLLADTKKELNEGRGYIYSIDQIAYYKNF